MSLESEYMEEIWEVEMFEQHIDSSVEECSY